jgi:predicted nucleic acid-binding protein
MRLLIDTNIFLEVILEQERADEARALLALTETHEFFISDYSFHSIGVLLFRRKRYEDFQVFVNDMILNAGTTLISLAAEDMTGVIEAAQKFNLDFDDAYQYKTAEKYTLTLASFDTDFDRTERGRKSPAQILQPDTK